MTQRLKNQRALITGAAQNIGRAIAVRFAEEGAAVALADIQEEPIVELASEIKAKGGKAVAIPTDLADRSAVEAMVERAISELGGLDVLVNNAYNGPYKALTGQDDAGWDRAIAIGVHAIMAACRKAVRQMQKQGGGSIINLGSINSFTPAPSMAVYSAVKGAVVNFSRQLAVEYGPDGIRTNALCPGYITHDKRNAMFEEKPLELDRVLATIPLRKLGQCEDIANAALFLAGDESGFVNGHSLVVDGGSTIQNARTPTVPFESALRARLEEGGNA